MNNLPGARGTDAAHAVDAARQKRSIQLIAVSSLFKDLPNAKRSSGSLKLTILEMSEIRGNSGDRLAIEVRREWAVGAEETGKGGRGKEAPSYAFITSSWEVTTRRRRNADPAGAYVIQGLDSGRERLAGLEQRKAALHETVTLPYSAVAGEEAARSLPNTIAGGTSERRIFVDRVLESTHQVRLGRASGSTFPYLLGSSQRARLEVSRYPVMAAVDSPRRGPPERQAILLLRRTLIKSSRVGSRRRWHLQQPRRSGGQRLP